MSVTVEKQIANEHRPWPPPDKPWVMAQTWNDVLFAHWRVPVRELRAVVPKTLPLDTYDGHAWIGIVPFTISGLRLRATPPVPFLSTFPELNVRTYVIVDDKPGVYFFSLDVNNPLAVTVARTWYHLNYFNAQMTVSDQDGEIRYTCRRVDDETGPAALKMRYWPVGPAFRAKESTLEQFLTERYCLYAVDAEKNVYRAEINHAPWELRPAACDIAVNSMTEPLGLELSGKPLLHYSKRQDMVAWTPERL